MQGKLRARDALRQNQADHVAHLRKAKLARVREQIKVFVGPVFSHLLVAHMSIVSEIADPNFVEKFMGLRPRKSMWTVSDGALAILLQFDEGGNNVVFQHAAELFSWVTDGIDIRGLG